MAIENETDSIMEKAHPDIEVTVRMLNINYGHNKELLTACKPLDEYAWFVGQIQKNNKTMELGSAIDKALDDMPDNYEIKPLLTSHRAEVKGMCINEYNEAETMQMFKEEGREEGREEGLIMAIRNLMESLHLTAEKAMDTLKIPQADRADYASKLR